ncbi:MAG: hypothetical protein R3F14_29825 [Polyangiaceae bacterium]
MECANCRGRAGPRAEELESTHADKRLSTLELLHLVTPDVQIIDGEIVGYSATDEEVPVILFRAVDSTSWDVESDDSDVLALIRTTYPDARDIPR